MIAVFRRLHSSVPKYRTEEAKVLDSGTLASNVPGVLTLIKLDTPADEALRECHRFRVLTEEEP